MHARMEGHMAQQQQADPQTSASQQENKKEQVGDYIDFEELK